MAAKRSVFRAAEGTTPQQKRAQWSTQSYMVEDLLQQFSLPQIVKCNPQAILVKKDSPLPVNLGQPILLFDSRTVRKLLARNVVVDPMTGKFTENDDTVVIPRDYDGSFLRLRSRTSKDHTTHKTVESMAQSKIRAFLNLTKLSAFVIAAGGAGEYPRIDYRPGNVFAIDGIFSGSAKLKQDGKVLVHKNNSSSTTNYLKARDEKDTNIVIPLAAQGEFVEILPNDLNGKGRMSVESSDLIEKQKFPIIVRYIRGRVKPRLTSFTGLLTLLDSYEETTILGCVLDNTGYTLIELPINSPLTFHLALNFSELQSHPIVRNGLKLCDTNGQGFARDLKFKFKFAQRFLQMGAQKIPLDQDDPGESPSARNSAKIGVTTTYLYL